jgi:serine/threonine-protein kinase
LDEEGAAQDFACLQGGAGVATPDSGFSPHKLADALPGEYERLSLCDAVPGKAKGRSPATDWTGRTLFGKWTVERVIGAGGTSTVLQARHRNGRHAALKVLHRHLADHGRMRERFLREGRLANLVRHPGVVAVLDDFISDDGTAVLVLELVDGKTLSALAKESGGILTQHAVVTAAQEVLDILAVAHEAKVVHRDIKPENILLCENGAYKLADFGLAGLCHELGMLTGTNQTLGTPAYMSPEQARGDTLHIDARTDIWGLGATMFTLLTGRYVHANASRKNLVVAAATEPAPSILSVEPGLAPSLAAVIDRALRTDKEERWPNALAMLAELRSIDLPMSEIRPVRTAATHDNTTLSTAPFSRTSRSQAETSMAKRPSARRPLELVLVALALAVLVALFVAARSIGPSSSTTSDSPSESKLFETAKPTGSMVSALPGVPPASREPRQVPSTPTASPRTVTRAVRQSRPVSKANPEVAASTAPPAGKTAADVSIPDEVLDRRE